MWQTTTVSTQKNADDIAKLSIIRREAEFMFGKEKRLSTILFDQIYGDNCDKLSEEQTTVYEVLFDESEERYIKLHRIICFIDDELKRKGLLSFARKEVCH
jgi:hypothetical protein